jgi:hypothetical protein
MPFKIFAAGEEALASDVNSYLMSQTVPRFTNAAQRTSQLASPAVNQLTMLDTSLGVVQYWNGTTWANLPNPAASVDSRRVSLASVDVGATGVMTLASFDFGNVAGYARHCVVNARTWGLVVNGDVTVLLSITFNGAVVRNYITQAMANGASWSLPIDCQLTIGAGTAGVVALTATRSAGAGGYRIAGGDTAYNAFEVSARPTL